MDAPQPPYMRKSVRSAEQKVEEADEWLGKGAPSHAVRALQPLGVATATEETAGMVATNSGVSLREHQHQGEELEPAVLSVPATVAEIKPQILRARVTGWPKYKAQGRLGTRREHLKHSVFKGATRFHLFHGVVQEIAQGVLWSVSTMRPLLQQLTTLPITPFEKPDGKGGVDTTALRDITPLDPWLALPATWLTHQHKGKSPSYHGQHP